MPSIPFKQVDVFTNQPFKGNPVAVVLDANGMSGEEMQQVASWTNLSETTFVLAPSSSAADYQVRIFTPRSELPFAGHPTIGTAYGLLEAGLVKPHKGELVQECMAGLVKLQVDESGSSPAIAFELPQPTFTQLDRAEIEELSAILGTQPLEGVNPRLVDVGVRWVVAQLKDVKTVLGLKPDYTRMKPQDSKFGAAGVVVFATYEAGGETQVEVRAFAPSCGVDEDPVCGSGNGCVAAFIRETEQTAIIGAAYLASQGQVVGRAGRIRLSIDSATIRVGGNAVTCIEGVLRV